MRKLLIVLSCFLVSCGGVKVPGLKKNFKKTLELSDDLFEKNGNVFMVSSTYANFSQVWSYGPDFRERYNLVKGVIKLRKKEPSDFLSANKKLMDSFRGLDPFKCGALDGDLMLILLDYNSKQDSIIINNFNLKCLFEETNHDGLMEKLIKDADFIHPGLIE